MLALFHTTPILRTAELTPAVGAKLGTLTVQLRNTTADERNHIWTAWGARPAGAVLHRRRGPGGPARGHRGLGPVTQHRVDYVGDAVILSSLTAVTHVLHVRHALSGGAVPSLSATLVPPTPWWYTAKLTPAGDVAVVAADRFPDDAADPVVRLSVADPDAAASLAQPLVEVTLSQAEQTHTFAPGQPDRHRRAGRQAGQAQDRGNNIRAVPGAGDAIALPEVAGEPGTYRSAPRAWTTAQLKFDIKAGDTSVGQLPAQPVRARHPPARGRRLITKEHL